LEGLTGVFIQHGAQMEPVLSVLIGARDAAATIESCLASLELQIDERVEIVVADASSDGTADLIEARFPWVRLLRRARMNAGQLRREAWLASRGRLIALAEPHITFAPGWVRAALTADRHGALAVGGAVALKPDQIWRVGAWAAFLCEYADFLPPLTAGVATVTTGNNVVYPRSVLETSDLRDGLWKAWVNDGLVRHGGTLWTDPTLLVWHQRPYRFHRFLTTRFHHGRCYAATRAGGWSWKQRVIRAVSTPLLPPLFAYRIFCTVLPKPRYLVPLFVSQPLLFLFHCWWAIGEAYGYLVGPGDSWARLS
jgi:glycosyltransferase involved in cell wall biosynthesis